MDLTEIRQEPTQFLVSFLSWAEKSDKNESDFPLDSCHEARRKTRTSADFNFILVSARKEKFFAIIGGTDYRKKGATCARDISDFGF